MAKPITIDTVRTKYPVGQNHKGEWCVYTNNSKAFIFKRSYSETKSDAVKFALEEEARFWNQKVTTALRKLDNLEMLDEQDPRGILC